MLFLSAKDPNEKEKGIGKGTGEQTKTLEDERIHLGIFASICHVVRPVPSLST